jgi:patatin-like phospholipase
MIELDLTLSDEPYSPQRRTALVLSGTGTAGAYHAGVLRALHEAGVKLDIVAGRGIGVIGALFAAVDGAQRLWDEKGFWRADVVSRFYPWRFTLRLAVWALAVSVLLVAVPLAAVAVGLVVFPIDFLLKMVGVTTGGGLTAWYVRFVEGVFAREALPTWLPRMVLIVLASAAAAAIATAWLNSTDRRQRGSFWWRIVPSPISAGPAVSHCWKIVWDLIRGAAQLRQPPPAELGRRYTELLAENIGQPGFRELLIVVHDVDAGRDLVFALVAESRRRDLVRRPTTEQADARRAEVLDLSGLARDHLADAVAAALTVPLATALHPMRFAPDAYWQGEIHRLCDRPASLERVLEELTALGVEQVVLVSAAPESPGPHALRFSRLEARARLGEYLHSSEAAMVRDVTLTSRESRPRIYTIRPSHNPIGPFDFAGGFDDRSDRRQPLTELMSRGYQDAYHQFVEPVVGASGDRVGHSDSLGSGL